MSNDTLPEPGPARDRLVAEVVGLPGVGYYRRESWHNTRWIACTESDVDRTDPAMPLTPRLYYRIGGTEDDPRLFAVPPYSTSPADALAALEAWCAADSTRDYRIDRYGGDEPGYLVVLYETLSVHIVARGEDTTLPAAATAALLATREAT